jgi:hypothetical protein
MYLPLRSRWHLLHRYPGWMIRSVYGPYYRRNIGRRNTDRIVSVYGTVTVPYYCAQDYGGNTDRIVSVYRTVLSQCTAPYTVPYYCAQDYGVIQPIYGRKLAVFSSFSVRKRPVNDAVLIDLGTISVKQSIFKMSVHDFILLDVWSFQIDSVQFQWSHQLKQVSFTWIFQINFFNFFRQLTHLPMLLMFMDRAIIKTLNELQQPQPCSNKHGRKRPFYNVFRTFGRLSITAVSRVATSSAFSPFSALFLLFRFFVFSAFLCKQLYFPIKNSA